MEKFFFSRRWLVMIGSILALAIGFVVIREVIKRTPSPELVIAQEKWRSLNIRDYRFEVEITYPTEPSLGGESSVVVRNGELESEECISRAANCMLFWAPDDKQGMDILFDMAHYNRMLEFVEDAYIAEGCLDVTFDEKYGYPKRIDNTNCIDPEYGINHGIAEVTSFEVIDPKTTPGFTKGPLPDDWTLRWLNNPVCQLPCWEGITPGVTTSREAFELLKQNPMFTEISMRRIGEQYEKQAIIGWVWFGQQVRGEIEFLLSGDEIVSNIEPFASWSEPPFSLGQIVEAFGEPDDVITTDFCPTWQGGDRFYHLEFRYQTLGLYIDGPYKYLKNVESNLPIKRILIFDPQNDWTDFAYTNTDYHSRFVKISSWQGYRDFYFYSETDPNLVCP